MKFKQNFKNLWQHRRLQVSLAIVMTMATVWACKNNGSDFNNSIDMPSGSDGLIQMKYTAETFSHIKTDAANGKLTGLEEIKATPITKRAEISMVVFEDGTCDMTTRELEPKFQPIKRRDLTPPSTRPKGVVTRVMRDGTVKVYDKDNKEIRTFKMNQKLDMSKWVEIVKKDAANINQSEMVSYIFGNKMGGVKAMLEEVKKNGGTVTKNDDGTLLVSTGGGANSLNLRNADKTFSQSVVDPNKNTVLRSAVFDKGTNKMLGRMAFTYKKVGNSEELTHIYMESLNPKSPSDRLERMISTTELSDVSIKINR
jgi:hypothetical protein